MESLSTCLDAKDGARNKGSICPHNQQECQGSKDPSIPWYLLEVGNGRRRSSEDNRIPFHCGQAHVLHDKSHARDCQCSKGIDRADDKAQRYTLESSGLSSRICVKQTTSGLNIPQTKESEAYMYVDADYAKDEDDRRSISGRMSTLGGMLVGWNSKKQHTVLLSSCESKYISYGEAYQEAVFMNQLLDKLLQDNSSAIVYGDNQGALFLVKNWQVTQRIKHIDIRSYFVQDLQRAKKVIGAYVQSEENMANGAMKNLAEKLFATHVLDLKTGINLISQREDVRDSG